MNIVYIDLDLEKEEDRVTLQQKCAEGFHVIWMEKNLKSDGHHDYNEHLIILEADK
jgi:hypothetical protein